MAAVDHSSAESETRSGFWRAVWLSASGLPLTSALSVAVFIAWIAAWIAVAFVGCISVISLIVMLGVRSAPLSALAVSDPTDLSVWTVGGMGGISLLIMILAYMRGIFRSLADGDPFVPDNARRLRRIAAALAVLELLRHLVVTGAAMATTGKLPRFDVNFVVWIAVAILIVLAHIFAQGARLREDAKLTV